MPRPNLNRVQVVLRIPREWLTKADAVAKNHSKLGWALSRTDGFRIALATGLEALQAEHKKRRAR